MLECKKCGTTHEINPPKKKLKKTATIELKCFNCGEINNYTYVNIVKVS